MRRKSNSKAEAPGQDSFLDVVANLVGILIILVMIVSAHAKKAMIAEETANSVTLKVGTTTEVVLRSQIAKSETGTKSLMPDGLESILNPQAVADLIEWIRRPVAK